MGTACVRLFRKAASRRFQTASLGLHNLHNYILHFLKGSHMDLAVPLINGHMLNGICIAIPLYNQYCFFGAFSSCNEEPFVRFSCRS